MNVKRVLLITTACVALLAPALGMAAESDGYDEAVAQYQQGHWANAYGQFMALANAGDADAARTALFMLRYGPQLYKAHWDAIPAQVRHWEQLAESTQGRSTPLFQPVAAR